MVKHLHRLCGLALLSMLAAACQPKEARRPADMPKSVKIGKPYVIEGKTYYPEADDSYDKTGMASWYGPGFHGKYTANGEVFDQHDVTAAHPTLPMPSLVRVTNLENGRSLVVRINDRGPFKSERIIDLSKKSAERLGIHSTTKVRVQYLKKETEEFWASLSDSERDNIKFTKDEKRAKYMNEDGSFPDGKGNGETTVVMEDSDTPGAPRAQSSAAPVLTVSSQDLSAPGSEKAKPVAATGDEPAKPVEIRPLEPKMQMVESGDEAPTLVQEPKSWDVKPIETMAEPTPVRPAKEARIVPAAGAHSPKVEPKIINVKQAMAAQSAAYGKIDTSSEAVTFEGEASPAAGKPAASQPTIAKAPAVSAGASGYYIQAGSFSSQENAQKLSDRLKTYGKTHTDVVEAAGRNWYRVRIGPFANRNDASSALEKVRSHQLPDARLIQN